MLPGRDFVSLPQPLRLQLWTTVSLKPPWLLRAPLSLRNTADPGETYFLIEHLHDSLADVVYQDAAGWALVRVADRNLEVALKQGFLWPLPEAYSLRGLRQAEPSKKPGQTAPQDLVDAMLEEVDSALLREHVRKLALLDPSTDSELENLRTRYAFRPETLESTRYIRERMEEYLGEDLVQTHLFEVAGSEMFNVVGLLPGADPAGGYYVVCAHYDAIGARPPRRMEPRYRSGPGGRR